MYGGAISLLGVAQLERPARDLHLSAYNWTAACAAGGREVWQIDAGNEWPTREEAEAAIARHEDRITFGGAVHVATDSDGCEAAELALLSTLVTAAAAALAC